MSLDDRLNQLRADADRRISVPGDLQLGLKAAMRAHTPQPIRPSLWQRLKLGETFEIAAACLLLAGLIGVAAYRNINGNEAPGGGGFAGVVAKGNNISLTDVSEVRVSNLERTVVRLSTVQVSDQEAIDKLLKAWNGEKQLRPRDVATTPDFTVDILLKSGNQVTLGYVKGQPLVAVVDGQNLWIESIALAKQVENMGIILQKRLMVPPTPQPKPYIAKEKAVEIAKSVDSTIDWKAYLRETQFDLTVNGVRLVAPLWIVESSTADSQDVILYLDAMTGQEKTRVKVDATKPKVSTPEEAIKRFYELTSQGRYKEAWPLLHPVSQKPNPPTALGTVLAFFYSEEGKPGPKLQTIMKVVHLPEGWKDPMCMCQVQPAARVTIELDNGTQEALVAQDRDQNWRVLWSRP